MFYKLIPFLFILNIVFSYKNNNTPLYSKNFFNIQNFMIINAKLPNEKVNFK